MLNWQVPQNCNNAPKQQWLIEWLQAWASGETDSLTLPTLFTLNGVASQMTDVDFSKVKQITIHSVLTHGREGAIRAQGWLDEASGSKQMELMLFAKFTLSKASEMKEIHILYTIL